MEEPKERFEEPRGLSPNQASISPRWTPHRNSLKDQAPRRRTKQRLKEARQMWKSKFGNEPLVKLVISNKKWTRKKYDQWKDGIKYPYDHSRLSGYTYRRINGVIRGELVTWWKNNIEGTEWVEICPRTEAFGDCFYYDLLEENLNK